MESTKNNKLNNLVIQSSILVFASIIVRLIGFFYRIPITNLLHDEGSGYYANAFTIYTFLLMISTYGFPSTISKLTAEKYAQKKYKEAQYIFKSALSLALILGIVFSAILWFGAKPIAVFSGSAKSYYAIRAIAPALFCFAILSVLRGYFQGMQTMVPTAVSQIIEQIFNAAFSLILAAIFMKKGVEYGASGSSLGTGIGAFSALLFLLFIYQAARKRVIRKNIRSDRNIYQKKSVFFYWKTVIWLAVPMVLGSVIMNFTNVMDVFMFQRALLYHGLATEEVAKYYGLYSMKILLIINLPVSVAAAFSTASLPGLSASVVKKELKSLQHKISTAIRAVLLIAIPAAVGLLVLAEPIINMLFRSESQEATAIYLQLSTLSVIFLGISTVSIGLIQGLGKLKKQVFIAAIAFGIKVLLNIILLYVIDLRIYGAIISNTIYAFIAAYLSLKVINEAIAIKINIKKTITIPIIASGFMGIVGFLIYDIFGFITRSNTISTLLAIMFSLLTYGVIMIKLKGIEEEEIINMPKGLKISKLLKKIGLLA